MKVVKLIVILFFDAKHFQALTRIKIFGKLPPRKGDQLQNNFINHAMRVWIFVQGINVIGGLILKSAWEERRVLGGSSQWTGFIFLSRTFKNKFCSSLSISSLGILGRAIVRERRGQLPLHGTQDGRYTVAKLGRVTLSLLCPACQPADFYIEMNWSRV